MDFLKSGWKTVVGAPQSVMDDQPNVAETVERLVERVETSTLLEDRRDACRALKSLSKTYRLEVGAQAMDALLFVLQNDTNDNEIVTFALETLNNIIGNEEDLNTDPSNDLSIQFTEIFIKRKENVQLIIDLLAEFDFKIRWPTIKLLFSLLRNKLRDCQDCILTYPMGISRMMDLLLDPREVIRNDALLLLVYLTKNNTNIQKIVAFENAFDRILDIISTEGYSDGGVIVEDCLSILLNLLKANTSNQNFFKEGSYINRLIPFLDFSFETSWNPQKVNNLLLMFKVIRSLVSPNNPQQVTSSCQKVMNQNGVLQKLCAIQMSNGIPPEIVTETINCVAEVIRGNQTNQDYFSRVNAPIEPPKPVIVILLMSMINEKQPFEFRCAVLYCFQCFLYRNDLGQAQVVETLLPSTTEVPTVTAGQLLCSGFFSYDSLSNWFVAVALAHTVLGNATQKEQLVRVQLATDSANPPTSLLAYCSSLLQQGGHYQRRISLLMLLAMWLSESPVAVASFVSISTNVPFLTSQAGLIEGDDVELIIQGLCAFLLGICICYNNNSVPSFTRDDLCQIINNRLGKETFIDKLSLIPKHEKYSQAIQRPQLCYAKPSDVLFDYEFCNLFRSQEPIILKQIHPATEEKNAEQVEDAKLVSQYKELIREQDEQLNALKKSFTEMRIENEFLHRQLAEQNSIIQQLRDQVSLLKAQKTLSQSHHDGMHGMENPAAGTVMNSYQQYQPYQISTEQASITTNIPTSYNHQETSNHYSPNDPTPIEQMMAGMTLQEEKPKQDPNQIDYLINENRRLLTIIDQYKQWEQNYYAYYNSQQPPQQEQQPSQAQIETNQEQESVREAEKLRSELDTIRKEQDELLSLLGDQNLKIQFYENQNQQNYLRSPEKPENPSDSNTAPPAPQIPIFPTVADASTTLLPIKEDHYSHYGGITVPAATSDPLAAAQTQPPQQSGNSSTAAVIE